MGIDVTGAQAELMVRLSAAGSELPSLRGFLAG